MAFPIPGDYSATSADVKRDQSKRIASPPSFFFAQSQGIKLAASYFTDARLTSASRGGVATKHRQKIQNAAFGQMMASFEFCVKDFVAQVIDSTNIYDAHVEKADWIKVDKTRILAQRESTSGVGAVLVHPLLGWHNTSLLNERFKGLFDSDLVDVSSVDTLERLWILRHSIAHNAGFITGHDSYRIKAPELSEKQVKLDPDFLGETHEFLGSIVRRLADPIGTAVMRRWFDNEATRLWDQDKDVYRRLKLITTIVESRTVDLPDLTEADYSSDIP